MTRLPTIVARAALPSLLLCGVMSAASLTGDLSKYRDFQLGTNLAAVAKQVGVDVSRAKVIQRRPVLIQELEWRPQPLGASSTTESAQEVVFSFYAGELFRIAVSYDRYATEGLTPADFIEAISAAYGVAEKPRAPASAVEGPYGDPEEVIARWQDTQYCFELLNSASGPSFRMIGVLKKLQAPAQAALLAGKRIADQEAPQRDAARLADEKEAERTKLEKSRLLNKPNFRP